MIEIRHRYSGEVLLRVEADTLAKANLRGAILTNASLKNANLRGADLREADLYKANLYGVSLAYADMYKADLSGANLYGARLHNANLTEANLRGASLTNANLLDANLTDANLADTVLDPNRSPNQQGDFQEVDGECVGYRTRRSMLSGDNVYQDGKVYRAEVFSTCPYTACHPGLYVYPTAEEVCRDYPDVPVIEVRCKRADLHKAGRKYRVREFRVIGGVESRPKTGSIREARWTDPHDWGDDSYRCLRCGTNRDDPTEFCRGGRR